MKVKPARNLSMYFALAGVLAGIAYALLHDGIGILAQSGDTTPPVISDVELASVGATSSVVTWKTNEKSDSLANYGLDTNYGLVRVPSTTLIFHELTLGDLQPSTKYFFRVISADPSGNQSISTDYSFTTGAEKAVPGIEKVKQEEQKTLTEKTANLIDKVEDPEAIKILAAKVGEAAEKLLNPPVISGQPKVETGSDYAVVTWTTDQESNSMVALAAETQYDPSSGDPYSFRQGNPDDRTLTHEVRIEGLRPATKYHFQVSSQGIVGPAGVSDDYTFTTKAILPQISNVALRKVEEDSATIVWTTNIPSSAIVEYTDLNTTETKIEGDASFVTNHQIRLKGLKFSTPYSAIIKVENEIGDRIVSDPITFLTVKDIVPPVISNVTNESTLYPGADAKIQTIVSWETDEPAICQFFFHAGLVATQKPTAFAPELNYTSKHVQVVTEFVPSTIYKFWAECTDDTGNKVKSEDFVLLTPEKEKSIIDIILENFEGTFGWVKNIGK